MSNCDIKSDISCDTMRFISIMGKKAGFLLIELMIAVTLGLLIITALMHMQSTLIELQENFYTRNKALTIAIGLMEEGKSNSFEDKKLEFKNNIIKVDSRNFVVNLQNSDENKYFRHVKVGWMSVINRQCYLEL
jgi:Tfp pilus assembly protein PilV